MLIDPLISEIIRLVYAGIFLFALHHKVTNRREFESIISAYDVLPATWSKAAAIGVILCEIGLVLTLFFVSDIGVLLGMSLLCFYAVLMGFNIMRGHTQIDCGCFWGSQSETKGATLTWMSVIRNLVLVLIGLIFFLPTLVRSYSLFDFVSLIGVMLAIFLIGKITVKLAHTYGRMKDYGHV